MSGEGPSAAGGRRGGGTATAGAGAAFREDDGTFPAGARANPQTEQRSLAAACQATDARARELNAGVLDLLLKTLRPA